jgi:hypothetical protein
VPSTYQPGENHAELFELPLGVRIPPKRLGKKLQHFAGRNVRGWCFGCRPGHGGVNRRPDRRGQDYSWEEAGR